MTPIPHRPGPLLTPRACSRSSTRTPARSPSDRGRFRSRARCRGAALRVHLRDGAGRESKRPAAQVAPSRGTMWRSFRAPRPVRMRGRRSSPSRPGKFVTDSRPTLSWTLGLGLCHERPAALRPRHGRSSPARLAAPGLIPRPRNRSVLATSENRSSRSCMSRAGATTTDSIRARYGPVEILASLEPRIRVVDHRRLAPHGFFAEAPGLLAGDRA